jgi:methylenetetrahydrofolate reductase (NADPH)
VFVVAGDLDQAEGPFEDSLSLIRSGLLQAHGVRRVGLAGHPDGHTQIEDAHLWRHLIDKVEALRSLGLDGEIVTQFGFDAEPFLGWLARLRREGVVTPVRIGLPGPANITTLLRFAARCGVGASTKVLAKYGISMTRLIGSAGPDTLMERLEQGLSPAVHGDVRIHLYPFGGLVRAAAWANAYTPARPADLTEAPIALCN